MENYRGSAPYIDLRNTQLETIMRNARDYPLYEDMGVNLDTLGAVMLRVESPLFEPLPVEDAYYSGNPDRYWIDGVVNEEKFHVTLRYGFMPEVKEHHVDEILENFPLPLKIDVGYLEVFPTPYEDEPYECLVVRVRSDGLSIAHTQLGILPNLLTFTDYKPHITLGYFKPGFFDAYHKELYSNLKLSVAVKDYYVGRNMRT